MIDVKKIYLLLFMVLIGIFFLSQRQTVLSTISPPQPGFVTVIYVIDGDSLRVKSDDNITEVRLIGIDAPEASYNNKVFRDAEKRSQDAGKIVALGKLSKNYLQRLLPVGSQIRLSNDVTRFDRYGRILAYAYDKNDEMINLRILRDGYAYPYSIPPNLKHQKEFQEAGYEARKMNRGLWNANPSGLRR